MDQKNRTALYGRTSSDDERTCSIETQQLSLRQWAANDPLVDKSHVGEFWDQDVSGKIPLSQRPHGKRLIESLERGEFTAVAVKYADRFGRTCLDGLKAAADLEQLGVKIVCTDEGWDARRNDDPLYFQIRLAIAEAEHRRITERFRAGRERSMEKNNAPPVGTLTFGYRLDHKGQYVVWPEQAVIVLSIYERFLAGENLRSIARWLQTQGGCAGRRYQRRDEGSVPVLLAKHAKARVTETKVRRILTNRTYLGVRAWGNRTFPCPRLVSDDIFERVQRQLAVGKDGRNTLRSDPAYGLLSGILRCGICGKVIYACTKCDKKAGKQYRYRKYVCQGFKDSPACKCYQFRQPILDELVWDRVAAFLRNPGELLSKLVHGQQAMIASNDELLASEKEYKDRMAELDKEAALIWQKQRELQLPLEWVFPQLELLKESRAAEQRKLHAARSQVHENTADTAKLEELQSALVSIRLKLSSGLTAPEKRHILELLLASATVHTTGSGFGKTGELVLGFRWAENQGEELSKVQTFDNSPCRIIPIRISA